MENRFDVIVIGGGQSGLAMGNYLRRTGFTFVIFDDQKEPGGAWLHVWRTGFASATIIGVGRTAKQQLNN